MGKPPPITTPSKLPAMTLVSRLRLWVANSLIVMLLVLTLSEALPLGLPAWQGLLRPVTQSIGLSQGWGLFAPSPDATNSRLRAEITYRDGKRATWQSPNWPELSLWQRFVGHRYEELYDNNWTQEDAPAWPGWARHLARQERPDFPDADRGAEVKIIVAETPVSPAEIKPWKTWRTPVKYDEWWTLTIEKLP